MTESPSHSWQTYMIYLMMPNDCVESPRLCFIDLFGVLCRFQHCTGHIMMGSWKDRGNQYIQLVKVLYTADQRQATTSFPT